MNYENGNKEILNKMEQGFLKASEHHLKLSNLYKDMYQISQQPNDVTNLILTLKVQQEIEQNISKSLVEIMGLQGLEHLIYG